MDSRESGLRILLSQLGIETRWHVSAGVLLILTFEVAIIGLAVGEAYVERWISGAPWVLLTVVWVIWTAWHSWLFPRNRLRYLKDYARPYRRAFVLDVFPWVSVGFSQMWRPLINGDNLTAFLEGLPVVGGSLASFLAGLTLCVAALVVITYAIQTIGIHNAAFLREFVEPETFAPIRTGIYSKMMHPLFWSGILYSAGLGIGVGRRSSLIVAGINCVYGLLYNRLENRRLGRIFGSQYRAYIAEVPDLVPKLRRG